MTTPRQAIEGLAEAMARLLADETLRERMGRAARIRATTTFCWEARAERMMQIYREVLAESGVDLIGKDVSVASDAFVASGR